MPTPSSGEACGGKSRARAHCVSDWLHGGGGRTDGGFLKRESEMLQQWIKSSSGSCIKRTQLRAQRTRPQQRPRTTHPDWTGCEARAHTGTQARNTGTQAHVRKGTGTRTHTQAGPQAHVQKGTGTRTHTGPGLLSTERLRQVGSSSPPAKRSIRAQSPGAPRCQQSILAALGWQRPSRPRHPADMHTSASGPAAKMTCYAMDVLREAKR